MSHSSNSSYRSKPQAPSGMELAQIGFSSMLNSQSADVVSRFIYPSDWRLLRENATMSISPIKGLSSATHRNPPAAADEQPCSADEQPSNKYTELDRAIAGAIKESHIIAPDPMNSLVKESLQAAKGILELYRRIQAPRPEPDSIHALVQRVVDETNEILEIFHLMKAPSSESSEICAQIDKAIQTCREVDELLQETHMALQVEWQAGMEKWQAEMKKWRADMEKWRKGMSGRLACLSIFPLIVLYLFVFGSWGTMTESFLTLIFYITFHSAGTLVLWWVETYLMIAQNWSTTGR